MATPPAAVEPGRTTRWLGSPAPLWASISSVGLAIALGLYGTDLSPAAIALALGLGANAAILCRRGACLGDLVLALLGAAMVRAAGGGALGLDGASWATPFVAQDPGQRPLLLLRAGVLATAVLRLSPFDRRRSIALAGMGALFVGSLAWRGVVAGAVVVSMVLIRQYGQRVVGAAPAWIPAAVLAAPLVVLVPRPATQRPVAPSGSPAEVVAAWRARGNLPHAHAAAVEWARGEARPGEGHLVLAELDHEVGQDAKARKVLEKVLANPASEDVRRSAADDERKWNLP